MRHSDIVFHRRVLPVAFGASGSSESVRPGSRAPTSGELSLSPHPPPTTFLRKAYSAYYPRNCPDKQSSLVDDVASHHVHGDNPQRPTTVVDCQPSVFTTITLQVYPLAQAPISAHALNQDRSHESRLYCYD